MATPKRAVVLRLAELERYPTVRARYEITLPFATKDFTFLNPLRCNCPYPRPDGRYISECQGSCNVSISFAKLKAKAIRQTEKRWVWFSEARKLDDRLGRRLGTLGLLPFEIREMIWRLAVDDYKESAEQDSFCDYWEWEDPEHTIQEPWLHLPLLFEIPHESATSRPRGCSTQLEIFKLHHYFETDDEVKGGEMYLRFVSPQVKIEVESTLISTNAFQFHCPMALGRFLDQLSAHQRPLLRAITLGLFGCWEDRARCQDFMGSECQAWVAVIERLPATLRTVTFELVNFGLRITPLNGPMTQWPRGFLKDVNKFVALLELMTKKVRRQAPRADISLAGLDKMGGDGRDMIQSMLDEVEPFSEDFKKWSDQSRKNAMDQGV